MSASTLSWFFSFSLLPIGVLYTHRIYPFILPEWSQPQMWFSADEAGINACRWQLHLAPACRRLHQYAIGILQVLSRLITWSTSREMMVPWYSLFMAPSVSITLSIPLYVHYWSISSCPPMGQWIRIPVYMQRMYAQHKHLIRFTAMNSRCHSMDRCIM